MVPAEQTAIRAVNLAKRYRSGDGDLVVFDGLSLEVTRGEKLAIVGESGAGKSSLLHLLGGLDRPSSGAIWLGARNITTLGDSELADLRNRSIGFVWQIHYLLPEFTALENVMMPLLIRGASMPDASAPAKALLSEVGLEKRSHHRPGELSGGEQQRVALARALIGKPRLLLADEPTGNVDPHTGEAIGELFRSLHDKHGLASIIVTHNNRLARICSRVYRLDNGVLIDDLRLTIDD